MPQPRGDRLALVGVPVGRHHRVDELGTRDRAQELVGKIEIPLPLCLHTRRQGGVMRLERLTRMLTNRHVSIQEEALGAFREPIKISW